MADSSYVIDIATSMPEGEKTIAELDALTKNLLGAGVGADALHDAVAMASNALASAKDASVAANAALAQGNLEYRDLERAAVQAAKAQEKAAKLGVVPPEVAASVQATSAALEAHTTKLRGLETAAAGAAQREQDLAKTLTNVKQAASAGAKAFAEQERAVKQAEQAQNKATKTAQELTGTERWFKLREAMGSTEGKALLLGKAAGIAAGAYVGLTLAVVATTAALIAGVAALTAWAVGLADSKRSADLSSQAAEALGANLAPLSGLFKELHDETGLTSAELGGLTKRLREAGVPAGALAGALRDAALAERAMGKGGADSLISDIKASKGAITGFTNEVRGKLGVIVSKQMLGLDAQAAKLKKNFTGLFSGLNIDPVLSGLQRLINLFDETTVAGGTIKQLFESVFGPIVSGADKAAIVVEAFILGFLIGMTKLYIAIKPTVRAIAEFLGFDDPTLSDTLDTAKIVGESLAMVVAGLAVVFAAVGAALVVPIALISALAVGIGYLIAVVIDAGIAIYDGFVGAWTAVTDFLNGLIPGFGTLASDMMQGLINGLLGGGPAVIQAITGVAGGAIAAAKKALGIASPSKVFEGIGVNTGEGFAAGVDDTTPTAQDAMAAMVAPPETSAIDQAFTASGTSPAGTAPGTSPAGTAASGGGAPGWSGDLIVNMHGVAGAEDAAERFEEVITRIWKGDAAQLGAGAVAGG